MSGDSEEAIRRAWENVRRLEYLTRRQVALTEEIEELEQAYDELRSGLAQEEADVARLQGMSFTGLIASLSGEKDDRLRRERAEATAARWRVQGAKARLEHARAQLQAVEAELPPLQHARSDYELALRQRKSTVGDGFDELADLGRRLASVEADWWEHEEARVAGVAAIKALQVLLQSLYGASGASNVSMSDRSFAYLIEQGPLGQTDMAAWRAQQALTDFRRQLDDIGVEMRVDLPPLDVRWFAELFFDDLLSDVMRYDRIRQAGMRVQELIRWANGMVEHLAGVCADLSARAATVRRKWEQRLEA